MYTRASVFEPLYDLYGPSGSNQASLIALDINSGSTDNQCLLYVEEYEIIAPMPEKSSKKRNFKSHPTKK